MRFKRKSKEKEKEKEKKETKEKKHAEYRNKEETPQKSFIQRERLYTIIKETTKSE